MGNGPSCLFLRGNPHEYIVQKGNPLQLTFWPEEETFHRLAAPGEDYPWFFHERMQHHMANCVSPAVAAVMAEEDVIRKKASDAREKRMTCPELWDEVA